MVKIITWDVDETSEVLQVAPQSDRQEWRWAGMRLVITLTQASVATTDFKLKLCHGMRTRGSYAQTATAASHHLCTTRSTGKGTLDEFQFISAMQEVWQEKDAVQR